MSTSGDRLAARRAQAAQALSAFGIDGTCSQADSLHRPVRDGNGTKVYTIGYERRDGQELIDRLRDAGVELLVDVRERPMSRKADFRKASLEQLCNSVGISYESWTRLGSTEHQRARLRGTGDISEFRRRFRDFARRNRTDALDRLASVAKAKTIALLCYERTHEDCHRSIVADLLADRTNATVYAIT